MFVGVYLDIRFVLSHADGFLPYAFERMALTIARDGGLSPAEVVGAEAVPERPGSRPDRSGVVTPVRTSHPYGGVGGIHSVRYPGLAATIDAPPAARGLAF